MLIVFSLILGAAEFASAMALWKAFIYEETIQEANMYCFAFAIADNADDVSAIAKAGGSEGIDPMRYHLEQWGWLIPWAVDPLLNFCVCAEMTFVLF